MVSPAPFLVTVYDRAFVRRAFLADYEQLTATPRHNAVSTASLTLSGDHPRLGTLLADGARVTIDYDVSGTGSAYEQVVSGPVTSAQGTIPTSRSSVTIGVEGDLRLFGSTLLWPVPGAAITAQSAQAYDARSGPAETVIKAYASANMVTRLGLPVTVAATAGRGSTVNVRARMDTMRDLLLPVATGAGIGVRITQSGSALVLDCYTPTVRTLVLTEESGVLVGGSWTRTIDQATDVVLGGQGDATARVFRLVRSTARAIALGVRLELFRDATDLTASADIDARGATALSEAQAGAGVALQLSETSTFRYGRTVRVGDVVPVALATGVVVTDVVGSAVLTHDRRTGVSVSPRVGDDTASAEPNSVLARALARVSASTSKINTRR